MQIKNVQVQPSSDRSSWDYILQHGNPNVEAVLLDGNKTFRNKRTGKFSSSLNGLCGLTDDQKPTPGDLLLVVGVGAILWRLLRK